MAVVERGPWQGAPDPALQALPAYPDPPHDLAYHGLAGEIVRELEPHTEADPVAMLVTLLAAVGNIVGTGPHWSVSGRRHELRLNPVLVGPTSKGRKGTAEGTLRPVLDVAAPDWLAKCTESGLSSGEGLVWRVRDPISKQEPIKDKAGGVTRYQEVQIDPGITDKRVFLTEQEFASTLKVMGREGNTLSAVIRQAWDDGTLRTLTKNAPAQSTGAHITIVGHITQDELVRYLDSTEAANGFANRFIWVCVRRSKVLPDGGNLTGETIGRLGRALSLALDEAVDIGLITRDPGARDAWHKVYGPLSEGGAGLLGAVLSRAEAQVMRLACVYTILDGSRHMRREHLAAAIALWEYSDQSARFIFGDAMGDPNADAILRTLRAGGAMTQTEINHLFKGNLSAMKIEKALVSLLTSGKIRRTTEPSGEHGGRPTTIWSAA